MSWPKETARILLAADVDADNVTCGETRNGEVVVKWVDGITPVPQADVIAWANDSRPLPSGQLFSEWLAEHDGDTTKTRRRKLREAFRDAVDADDLATIGIRALVDVVADALNTPRKALRRDVLARMEQIAGE